MSINNKDYGFAGGEPMAETPADGEAGAGGNTLAIYSQDRITQLNTLYSGDNVDSTNIGAGVPAGVTDSTNGGYDTPFENNEESMAETPADGEAGAGGALLDIWRQDRVTLLKRLARGPSVTNNSTFPIPPGVVESSTGGYDTPFNSNEKRQGVAVSGKALDTDESPLSGTATFTDASGTVVSETDVTGAFAVSGNPPAGVEAGADTPLSGFDFQFTPSVAGVGIERNDIVVGTSLGTFQYGEVAGTVTDFEGNPVPGDAVSGPGLAAATDDAGQYALKAPGGVEVDLTALDGSETVTRTPSGGQSLGVDFQYGGAEIAVQLPDGTPVPGVPVVLRETGTSATTDDTGKARFIEAPPAGELSFDIGGGKFNRTFPGPTQGSLLARTQSLGFGVKGSVSDLNGNPIGTPDVRVDVDNPLVAEVAEDGSFAIGDTDAGEVTVSVAQDDRRFARADATVEVNNGEVVTGVQIRLPEQFNPGTR